MLLANRKALHETVTIVSLMLIACSLPFSIKFCSLSITIFVITQLLTGNIFYRLKAAIQNKFVLIFIGFYFLHIIGLLFTKNIHQGLFDLEKKASLLIFPLLIFPIELKEKSIKSIMLSFVFSCLILGLILISIAFFKFTSTGNLEYFILENLSAPTGIHRVYASMYFLFSIYILIYIKNRSFIHFKNNTIIYNFLISFFTLLIFLLGSRTLVITTFLSFTVITIYTIRKTRNLLQGISLMTLFLVFCASFISLNDRFRDIMSQTYQELDKGNSQFNHTGVNQRLEIWKASATVIQEHFMGVGTGDTEDALYNQYKKNNFIWGIQYKFNAHNQYLQTQIGLGIAGLTILLMSMVWPAYIAFQNKYYIYLGLLVLFSLCCLTESMLCTQKGIVFYAFFNSLLFFHYPDKKIEL